MFSFTAAPTANSYQLKKPLNCLYEMYIETMPDYKIVITDLRGKPFLKEKLQDSENNISVATLQTGAYILQGMDKNKNVIAAIKIFKQ